MAGRGAEGGGELATGNRRTQVQLDARLAFLEALKAMKDAPGTAFDLWTPLITFGRPQDQGDWISLIGMLIFGLVCGLFTAAVTAARHGAGQDLALDVAPEE